jgi:hypothetical protein
MAKDDYAQLVKSIGSIGSPCGGKIDETPPPLDV